MTSVCTRSLAIAAIAALPAAPAVAEQPVSPQPGHVHHEPAPASLFDSRDASGTAWLPPESPMYGLHRRVGEWELMAHGAGFLQFLYESGPRGSDQFGSINWVMGMARRSAGGGRLGLRAMLSVEPWTVQGCGYPDLLATGEVCRGELIRDRQHPHDFSMELGAEYRHGAFTGNCTAGSPASRRSDPSPTRTGCRRWAICSRRSPTTGSTPPTSPSAC
jgi:hypothetical protein